MNPDPFSLRELERAALGRLATEWDRTACLLLLIYQTNARKNAPKKRAVDFNPIRKYWEKERRGKSKILRLPLLREFFPQGTITALK